MAPRRSSLPPPTLEYLQEYRTERERFFAAERLQVVRMRELREQTREIVIPDKLKIATVELRDASLAKDIQRKAASWSINPPTLTCKHTMRRGDAAEENATKREKATEAIFEQAGARTIGMHTHDAINDAVCCDGAAWTKFVYTRDLWDERYRIRRADFEDDPPEKEGARSRDEKYLAAVDTAKQKAGNPFSWLNVDVLTLLPMFAGGRLTEVMEVSERPEHVAFRKYRLTRDQDGNIVSPPPDALGAGEPVESYSGRGSTSVTFIEHWDSVWCSYLVLGSNNTGQKTAAIVQQWKHGYGRVPYTPRYGLMMAHWKEKLVGWGSMQALSYLLEFRAWLGVFLAQLGARDAMAPFAHEVPTGGMPAAQATQGETGQPADGMMREEMDYGGVVYRMNPGERMIPIAMPAVAESFKMLLERVEVWIDELRSPRLPAQLSGLEGAGFAMTTALRESRLEDNPVMAQLERGLKSDTELMWHLIEAKVREPVWVETQGKATGHISLGPADLEDAVSIKWSINPEHPSAQLVEDRVWHERLGRGTASWAEVIEARGANPDEVRQGLFEDMMRASPEYIGWKKKLTFESAGFGELLKMAEATDEVLRRRLTPGGQMAAANGMGAASPPAMGNGIVPDMAALAMSPNGKGAGLAPMPGGTPGGPALSEAGAGAGMQRLGP